MAVPSLLYPITVHISSSDRLVDCTSLKRATEFVYSAILPQASKPFIYMSINLPPEHVDVNIHPTKKEVFCGKICADVQTFMQFSIREQTIPVIRSILQVSLLNQERIIEKIKDAIEEKLMNCNNTRIFQTQVIHMFMLT